MTVSDRPNRSGRWTKQKIQSSRYCECPGTQTTLQSLLDTTPPKRVPVLWDGPAPAPSKGSRNTVTPLDSYSLGTICRLTTGVYDRAELDWRRKAHALLGAGVSGRGVGRRGARIYGHSGGGGRHSETALCGVPGFVPSIVADAHRQGQDGSVGYLLWSMFFCPSQRLRRGPSVAGLVGVCL